MEDLEALVASAATFKWEDSPGLFHSCATCGKCLNSKTSPKTCYGTHAEPCVRYHQTLFVKGNSHKCDACRNSNEQHDKRHREIALLVEKIQRLDAEDGRPATSTLPAGSSVPHGLSRKPSLARVLTQMHLNEDTTDTKTCKTPTNKTSLKPTASCKLKREQKKAKKLAKATDKALQRQRQTKLQGIITHSVVERVDIALHGKEGTFLSTRPEVQCSMLAESVRLHGHLEKELGKSPRASDASAVNKLELGYVRHVLISLGIQPFRHGEGRSGRARRELVKQAAEAIYRDIELVANENRETFKRFCGYWRFTGRKTYYAMVRNNMFVDWETGAKLSIID